MKRFIGDEKCGCPDSRLCRVARGYFRVPTTWELGAFFQFSSKALGLLVPQASEDGSGQAAKKSHTPECAKIEQFAATLNPAKTYHLCVQDFDTRKITRSSFLEGRLRSRSSNLRTARGRISSESRFSDTVQLRTGVIRPAVVLHPHNAEGRAGTPSSRGAALQCHRASHRGLEHPSRLRVEGGERRSRSQWLHHRSSGIERVEKQTKRNLACVQVVRLHPVPSQPVTGGRNNGEAQPLLPSQSNPLIQVANSLHAPSCFWHLHQRPFHRRRPIPF